MEIWLSVASNCFEKVAVNCTCFCINGHDFSARTMAERKLWLRAISNMKVGRYLSLTGVLMCEGGIMPMVVCSISLGGMSFNPVQSRKKKSSLFYEGT